MNNLGRDGENEMDNTQEHARKLGELAAWQRNKMLDTGVSSVLEEGRIGEALRMALLMAEDIGPSAMTAFAEGYCETVDLSLNADWLSKVSPYSDTYDANSDPIAF
ncbi:MAG: hypothetical protein JXM70_00770 [Pirellulales bacterium]|nr:hypothetical protein [Pirellulales bacterium]